MSSGEEVVVEEEGRGKRKEVVVRCALKACRVLDSHGMLRKASQGTVHCGPGVNFCVLLTSSFIIQYMYVLYMWIYVVILYREC